MRSSDRWVVLHVFARACLDSFDWYLQEAGYATGRSGPAWMPFPVLDFPEREWVVLGDESKQGPLRFVIASLPVGRTARAEKLQTDDEHYRQHERALNESTPPIVQHVVRARPRRKTNYEDSKKLIDPLFVDRKASVGVTAMVLAVFAASDSE